MAKKPIRHVRQQARKHAEAHRRLKELLSRRLYVEKVWGVFLSTFVLAILTIAIFLNWGRIIGFMGSINWKPAPENKPTVIQPLTQVQGFKSGVLATYEINGQTADYYIRYLSQIPSGGYEVGVETVTAIGKARQQEAQNQQDTLLSSITATTELSRGFQLESVRQSGSLQKSILATYYLGEKTVDINSTLQMDAELLKKISNSLSVDVFAYLNQSSNRADALDGFTNLLETLNNKAKERSADLASVINFLTANSRAQDTTLNLTQSQFFSNLKIFNGPDAEKQLGDFIGLQQNQSEVKAKIGAYKGLKSYYDFFLPKLDNLIRAIKANRDPLIAGVKVVEIQNMTLPLILKEK